MPYRNNFINAITRINYPLHVIKITLTHVRLIGTSSHKRNHELPVVL